MRLAIGLFALANAALLVQARANPSTNANGAQSVISVPGSSTSCATSTSFKSTPSSAGKLGFAINNNKGDPACQTLGDATCGCKDAAAFRDDLKFIKQQTDARIVRGYSTRACNFSGAILEAASDPSLQFQVIIGVWPEGPDEITKQIDDLRQWVKSDKPDALNDKGIDFTEQLYAITVGSEDLYRDTITISDLKAAIKDVQTAWPKAKIGTADTWGMFVDGTPPKADRLFQAGNPDGYKPLDIALVNGFPYWQNTDPNCAGGQTDACTGEYIDNAPCALWGGMSQAFNHIEDIGGGKVELWVGETGWPGAGGTTRGKAFVEAEGQDSTNANKYFQNAICPLMNNFHYNVFYFEAFDEPNKKPEGETTIYSANHWGMMSTNTDTASGSLEVKPGFTPKCSGGGTQQRQSKRRLPPAAVAMPTDAPQMMAM